MPAAFPVTGRRRRPSWALPDAALALDFKNNRYWRRQGGLLPEASIFSVTRASGINLPDSAGVYQTLGNNTLPRTDRGLYVNGQFTNIVARLNPTVAQCPVRGNVTDAAGFGGFGNSIRFPGGVDAFAYQQPTIANGVAFACTFLVFMEDGNPPAFASATATNSNNTFAIVVNGSTTGVSPLNYVVRGIGGGAYIVSATGTTPASGTTFGIVQYGTNQNRAFRVCSYVLVTGSVVPPPIPGSSDTGGATLLASDIRAVQGVRPSNSQPEPFPGWEAAGLDNAFGILASVNIDRLSAANNRTIFQAGSANEFARLDFTTGNRVRMTLQTLGPELVSNPGNPFVNTTGWTQQQGIMSVVGGKLRATRDAGGNGRATTPITCVIGSTYRVVLTGISATATGSVVIANSTGSTAGAPLSMTSDGAYTFVATQTTHFVMVLASSGADGTYVEIGGISTKEVKTLTLESGIIGSTGLYDISSRFKPGDYALTVSGGVSGDTDASAETLPSGMATLRIGSNFGVTQPLNSWLEDLQIARAA
jgi:hypothetical protein